MSTKLKKERLILELRLNVLINFCVVTLKMFLRTVPTNSKVFLPRFKIMQEM